MGREIKGGYDFARIKETAKEGQAGWPDTKGLKIDDIIKFETADGAQFGKIIGFNAEAPNDVQAIVESSETQKVINIPLEELKEKNEIIAVCEGVFEIFAGIKHSRSILDSLNQAKKYLGERNRDRKTNLDSSIEIDEKKFVTKEDNVTFSISVTKDAEGLYGVILEITNVS